MPNNHGPAETSVVVSPGRQRRHRYLAEQVLGQFPASPPREVGPHRCLVTPDHLDEGILIAVERPGDQLSIIGSDVMPLLVSGLAYIQ